MVNVWNVGLPGVRVPPVFWAGLFGLLLWLGWPPLPFFPLLFVGWVPLLHLEQQAQRGKLSFKSFFLYVYLALACWNLATTWWVAATYVGTKDIATAIAGLLANLANPLLMAIPVLGFNLTRQRYGDALGYASLPAYWLAFEFFHLRWELAWPWLTLGYGLANVPQLYQWYEVTGPLGGSLWILVINILIFRLTQEIEAKNFVQAIQQLMWVLVVAAIPSAASLARFATYQPKGKPQRVVVVQPNVDPYSEKFDVATLNSQLQNLISLAEPYVDSLTDYVVYPETALPFGVFLDELSDDPSLRRLQQFRSAFPRLKLVVGIHGYARYTDKATPTARRSGDGSFYWDAFNTAIQLDSSSQIPYYHKSKLVPGVERMPYPEVLRFLEPLALDLGGTTGSLGRQSYRTVFFSSEGIGAAPLICYESVFSEYVNEYVQRGANLLFVITNDGWWGNTAGYKQHFAYARLLAVAMRRDLAQSANTGLSGFVDQLGVVRQVSEWWVPATLTGIMLANDELTFYVRYGDVLGRLAVVFTLVLLVASLWIRFIELLTKRKFPL